jgi:hypothetical protein
MTDERAWAARAPAPPEQSKTGPSAEPAPSVELVEERTKTSRTFLQPDGSLQTEAFTAPLHFQ